LVPQAKPAIHAEAQPPGFSELSYAGPTGEGTAAGAAARQRPMISRACGLRIKLTLDSQPSGNLGCVAGVTLGRGSFGRRSPLTLRSMAVGSRTGRAAAICISRQTASESMATAAPPPRQYPDRRVIDPCLHARTPPGNRQPELLESKRVLAGTVPPALSGIMCRGKASRGSKRARCAGENFAAACQTSVEFITTSGN